MTLQEIPKKVQEFEYDNQVYYYNDIHKADRIVLVEDKKLKFKAEFKCSRCNGVGSAGWSRDNGICYKCHGLGYYEKILNVTKNKHTAEARLVREIEHKEKAKKEAYDNLLKSNLVETNKLYSDNFYIILDTLEKTTYENRQYLKSLGCRWNSNFGAWFISCNKVTLEQLKGFKVESLPTKNLLNEYNRVDWIPLFRLVSAWKDQLEQEKKGDG